MRLTESQIRQIIISSVEARSSVRVHRLTEQQLRKAIRHHIKTGELINEGLLDLLKGALGGLFDAFSSAFSGALDAASSDFASAREKVRGELKAGLGVDEVPDMDDLAPDKNENDKLLMSVYVGALEWRIEDARKELEKIKGIESPYPPTDGSDAEEWMSAFSPSWESAAAATATLAAASREVSKNIPEARNLQKELESAGEDPVAVLEAAKSGAEFWSGTIIPQLKSVQNAEALEKADDFLKSSVQEAIFQLEDMEGHFTEMTAIIDEVLPKWIEARDATAEEVPEEEQEEAAEDAEDGEGGGVPEAVAGEEDALGGEIVGGGEDDEGEEDDGPEERGKKLETEAFIRTSDRRLLLTEKQLKRLVRRLIIN